MDRASPSALQRARVRLPIRAKLAVVSAALTFVILCLFATAIGALGEHRLRDGFDDDLRATAADLQERIRLRSGPEGEVRLAVPSDIVSAAASGGAAIRVLDRNSRVVASTPDAPDLGPPMDGVGSVPGFRVVSRPLFAGSLARHGPFEFVPGPVDGAVAFVQFGKPERRLERTIARVRLFLALGVLGGTALAFLGGLWVARRAMRPIADLTRAARQVARTRDPDVALPKPEANDEVADLAETLETMLRELGAARAETEAALARQREFVADASHELRTPLTSILANLELLQTELDGRRDGGAPWELDQRAAQAWAAEAGELAGSALRSSRRMRRLVADLLLLARADAGRAAPRRRVDLADVVREAAAEAGPLGGPGQLSLDVPASVVVDGAPDDLHRLALNLIENALLHTPPGTPVTVALREQPGDTDGEPGGRSALVAEPADGRPAPAAPTAVLEVADRGRGVPAELRERVFERFARGSHDASPTGGSGLGLAIVRAVAEAHGGRVELTDAPGGGARFVVRLPAAAGARSEGEDGTAGAGGRTAPGLRGAPGGGAP